LQKSKVALEPFFALETLNLVLHQSNVGRKLKGGAIVKMNAVVWLAFDKMHSFVLQGGAQIVECFVEKPREQEETWALIEPLQSVSLNRSATLHSLPTYSWRCIRLHLPPEKSFFSTTVTLHPAAARRAAVATPPAPAPMIMTLGCRASVFGIYSPIAIQACEVN
jgi:hypothetical protein